jgi:hypothetical protein
VNGTGNPRVTLCVPAPAPMDPIPTAAGMGRVQVSAWVSYGSLLFAGSVGILASIIDIMFLFYFWHKHKNAIIILYSTLVLLLG